MGARLRVEIELGEDGNVTDVAQQLHSLADKVEAHGDVLGLVYHGTGILTNALGQHLGSYTLIEDEPTNPVFTADMVTQIQRNMNPIVQIHVGKLS